MIGDEGVEHDEKHRNTINPEVVVDVEAGNPGLDFDKLHATIGHIETGPQRDGHEKAGDRTEAGQASAPAAHSGPIRWRAPPDRK
jgi:hypothetical protein